MEYNKGYGILLWNKLKYLTYHSGLGQSNIIELINIKQYIVQGYIFTPPPPRKIQLLWSWQVIMILNERKMKEN